MTTPPDEWGYTPLYKRGRRDRARRFIHTDGTVISRRKHIKISERISPERKAYLRFKTGKSTKTKTARKYERSIIRAKQPKHIREDRGHEEIKERVPVDTTPRYRDDRIPKKFKGLYRLEMDVAYQHAKTGERRYTKTESNTFSQPHPNPRSVEFRQAYEEATGRGARIVDYEREGQYNWLILQTTEWRWKRVS